MSNQFQPSRMKGVNQCANALMASSRLHHHHPTIMIRVISIIRVIANLFQSSVSVCNKSDAALPLSLEDTAGTTHQRLTSCDTVRPGTSPLLHPVSQWWDKLPEDDGEEEVDGLEDVQTTASPRADLSLEGAADEVADNEQSDKTLCWRRGVHPPHLCLQPHHARKLLVLVSCDLGPFCEMFDPRVARFSV
eukprot:2370402-Rhodomonas_salina.4